MNENTSITIVVPTLILTAGYVVITLARTISRSRRERYYADVQTKLIDRLGTGADALQFMQSDAARNLLSGPVETGTGYAGRILNGLQMGLILFFGGCGMFAASNFTGAAEGGEFLRIVGAILIAVGLGATISAGWSYLLMRKWGLLSQNREQ